MMTSQVDNSLGDSVVGYPYPSNIVNLHISLQSKFSLVFGFFVCYLLEIILVIFIIKGEYLVILCDRE